jgi:hypothetical protein
MARRSQPLPRTFHTHVAERASLFQPLAGVRLARRGERPAASMWLDNAATCRHNAVAISAFAGHFGRIGRKRPDEQKRAFLGAVD